MLNKIAKITIALLTVAISLCGILIAIFTTSGNGTAIANKDSMVAKTNSVNSQVTTFDYGTDLVTQTINTTQTANGIECTFELQSRERGLFCTIAVSLKGDRKGTVSGKAKNTFTLGNSTIPVWIVLWSAESKGGINVDVDPEGYDHTDDLNIFKSIDCSSGTGGKAKYWQAHAYWNFDNKGWEHGSTPVSYYDADAVYDKNK